MNAITSPPIRLDPKKHIYWLGKKRLQSVGSLVKRVTPEFDAAYHAERVAKREGKTMDQVLKEWSDKRDASCVTGHELHDFIELYLKGPTTARPCPGTKAGAWVQWFTTAVPGRPTPQQSLKSEGTEVIVGHEEYGYAGTLDLLASSSKTNLIHVFDWKQNKAFNKDNRYGEMLLPPFDDLPNCEHTRYSLQVSLYRLALERNGHEGKTGDSWIVHITEQAATPHRALDLLARAEEWVKGLKL
jgi:ATP-dependent exoDNAse (exonuclease V) beta subunit